MKMLIGNDFGKVPSILQIFLDVVGIAMGIAIIAFSVIQTYFLFTLPSPPYSNLALEYCSSQNETSSFILPNS